ncbi:unnamed protein product [Bursaphelenchus okinawaensis]|uniref:Uncharacterized protein n=1 Tax=Bursaphelenchus okinawaensis TaxID=465554 RepID=A0A811KB80_9BILA|nr:unnamed protein product [Bursaphelenchus okinawaensis]CAG9097424.1 unnamed protein product [Bursaphelenchus okinawaensis]
MDFKIVCLTVILGCFANYAIATPIRQESSEIQGIEKSYALDVGAPDKEEKADQSEGKLGSIWRLGKRQAGFGLEARLKEIKAKKQAEKTGNGNGMGGMDIKELEKSLSIGNGASVGKDGAGGDKKEGQGPGGAAGKGTEPMVPEANKLGMPKATEPVLPKAPEPGLPKAPEAVLPKLTDLSSPKESESSKLSESINGKKPDSESSNAVTQITTQLVDKTGELGKDLSDDKKKFKAKLTRVDKKSSDAPPGFFNKKSGEKKEEKKEKKEEMKENKEEKVEKKEDKVEKKDKDVEIKDDLSKIPVQVVDDDTGVKNTLVDSSFENDQKLMNQKAKEETDSLSKSSTDPVATQIESTKSTQSKTEKQEETPESNVTSLSDEEKMKTETSEKSKTSENGTNKMENGSEKREKSPWEAFFDQLLGKRSTSESVEVGKRPGFSFSVFL